MRGPQIYHLANTLVWAHDLSEEWVFNAQKFVRLEYRSYTGLLKGLVGEIKSYDSNHWQMFYRHIFHQCRRDAFYKSRAVFNNYAILFTLASGERVPQRFF